MQFQLYRYNWGYVLLIWLAGSVVNNTLVHFTYYPWFTIGFFVIWYFIFGVVVVWLWNLWCPVYLTFENTGILVGKVHYHIDEIESILIGKRGRSVFIVLTRKAVALQLTPYKNQRESMRVSLKQWANIHRIPIHIN